MNVATPTRLQVILVRQALIAFCALFWLLVFWIALFLFLNAGPVNAHDFYEFRCCSGSLDCRPVPDGAITEGPNGFTITATGEVVPYTDSRVRQSPDNQFHWCSVGGAEDSRTLCIYSPDRGF